MHQLPDLQGGPSPGLGLCLLFPGAIALSPGHPGVWPGDWVDGGTVRGPRKRGGFEGDPELIWVLLNGRDLGEHLGETAF